MRGRPTKSAIRQNIVEILAVLNRSYGYELFKIYQEAFPKVTLRSIYYHLQKGLSTGEFRLEGTQEEKGDYSWGASAQKSYYLLGDNARPEGSPRVKSAISRLQLGLNLPQKA